MLGSRPHASALYLERPRLLGQLPDAPGYVVWLYAPYGAGKSVLGAQWAAMLEASGWRSFWLSVRGAEPRVGLNSLLGLPPGAPWPATLAALEMQPSLVVLEDLDGDEDLGALLTRPRGLTLLASRGAVRDPELPRLMARGSLVQLGASDLAFTLGEAQALYGDAARAEAAWRACGGWALPLHIGALVGDTAPDASSAALLNGVRASLDAHAWRALLLLSSLPHLPHALADDAVRALAAQGFAQAQERGYVLHPLLCAAVSAHLAPERAAVVAAAAPGLPSAERAEAWYGTRDWTALAGLLEDEVLTVEAERVHAFEAALEAGGVARGPGRTLNLAYAFEHAGRFAEMNAMLEATIDHPRATPRQRLLGIAKALMYLDHRDPPATATRLLERGERAASDATPEEASQYALNLSVHFVNTMQWARARAALERALALLPADHPKRAGYERMVRGRRATIRWGEHGDLDAILAHYRTALAVEHLSPGSRAFSWCYQAFYALIAGDFALARASALEAEALRGVDSALALEARAVRAYVDVELEAFAPVCAALPDARYWNGAWVRTLHARALRHHGQPETALEIIAADDEVSVLLGCERALALQALGQHEQALETLRVLTPHERIEALWFHAARFELTGDPTDLAMVLASTSARERALPLLVPLNALPRERPDLARGYPLEAVLNSAWPSAIKRRLNEVPNLQLRVLGTLEVRVLGHPVTLTRRPWEVLVLLLFGVSRAGIAAALWPDASADAARNNLHVTLNALRRALEPWGAATYLTEDGLQRTTSDLGAVRAALAARDGAALLHAYAGELAPELDVPAIERERAALRAEVVAALIESAVRGSDAVPSLERALELDPFHEGALRALIQLLLRAGRVGHATQSYRAFAKRLREEFGLEPDPSTWALLGAALRE
jgi:DNA-binding SARP family transcriptional activator